MKLNSFLLCCLEAWQRPHWLGTDAGEGSNDSDPRPGDLVGGLSLGSGPICHLDLLRDRKSIC